MFIRRIVVSLPAGVIFAEQARNMLGYSLDTFGTMAGACTAAVAAWWVLGAAERIISGFPKRS